MKERLLVGEPKVLFIWRQVPVIDWPVDFLIGVTIPGETKIKWLVIECDGHDYHERTKNRRPETEVAIEPCNRAGTQSSASQAPKYSVIQ